MVIGLIGWHGLTYINSYRSLVTTVTYSPHPQHGCGCWADAPLMLLQHWFQILMPHRQFTAESCFSVYLMLVKSYALLKFKYLTVLHSCDLAGSSLWVSKRKWDVLVFRPSIFLFTTLVSNVPVTFLKGNGYKDRGKKEKHSVKCRGLFGGQWECCKCKVSVAVVVVGI